MRASFKNAPAPVAASVVRETNIREAQAAIKNSQYGGAARSKQAPLIEQTDEVLESVLKINPFGAFYVARAAARQMIKQGARSPCHFRAWRKCR